MQIDSNAALQSRQEILINAPVEKVWGLLTDLKNWPRWQPEISNVTMEGDLVPGTVFRWKAKSASIVSTLQEVEAPRRISWTGKAVGTQAVHIYQLEPQGSQTKVVVEESLAGWFPGIMKVFSPKFLEKSMSASLQTLKAAAEKA